MGVPSITRSGPQVMAQDSRRLPGFEVEETPGLAGEADEAEGEFETGVLRVGDDELLALGQGWLGSERDRVGEPGLVGEGREVVQAGLEEVFVDDFGVGGGDFGDGAEGLVGELIPEVGGDGAGEVGGGVVEGGGDGGRRSRHGGTEARRHGGRTRPLARSAP